MATKRSIDAIESKEEQPATRKKHDDVFVTVRPTYPYGLSLPHMFARQARNGTKIIRYFSDRPCEDETSYKLGRKAVLELRDTLKWHKGSTVDLRWRDVISGDVIHDCHYVLVRCPDLFAYRDRVVGFDEDRMISAVRVFFAEKIGSRMQLPMTLNEIFPLAAIFADSGRNVGGEILAWLFNKYKVKFDIIYDCHFPVQPRSLLETLNLHASAGLMSLEFIKHVESVFGVLPNMGNFNINSDCDVIAYLASKENA